MKRDFLHITDFTTEEIWETLELAKWLKDKFRNGEEYHPFHDKTMAMIFAKPIPINIIRESSNSIAASVAA